MAVAVPKIDGDGNITIHGRGAAPITVEFRNAAGAQIDVSSRVYYFEVEGVARILTTNGAQNYEKVITIPEADVVQIHDDGGPIGFALRNETSPQAAVEWFGKIRAVGFTQQPA